MRTGKRIDYDDDEEEEAEEEEDETDNRVLSEGSPKWLNHHHELRR
jgi:hypothetical protein